jgi:hypothetical protein
MTLNRHKQAYFAAVHSAPHFASIRAAPVLRESTKAGAS